MPIESSHFGYEGTLTLFHPDRLHRFEVITPRVPENTMGRFFRRWGECLYMAFAESVELSRHRGARRPGEASASPPCRRPKDAPAKGPDTIFLHPPALGGMMLGISRRHHAWTWSGQPRARREVHASMRPRETPSEVLRIEDADRVRLLTLESPRRAQRLQR